MIHIKQKVDAIHMYTDGWTNKQNWSVHTKDHHSALKRKEILTQSIYHVDKPKDIMLSKVSQTQKD